jgi:hypothetical protein
MRFSTTFNLKILEKERLVRVSVRTSDERIDEFYLPLTETSSIFGHDVESTLDKIGNEFIWIKRSATTNKIGIGLRNSLLNWSVFTMDLQHWIICREQFIEKYRNFQKNFKGERQDDLSHAQHVRFQNHEKEVVSKLHRIENGLEVIASIATKMESFSIVLQQQAHINNQLLNKLEGITEAISRLEEKGVTERIIERTVQNINSDSAVEVPEEQEEAPMFIPTITQSEGSGKIEVAHHQKEISTLLETLNQLKKLRRK